MSHLSATASGTAKSEWSLSWFTRGLIAFGIIASLVGLGLGFSSLTWAKTYPSDWVIPAAKSVSSFVTWLQEEATLGFMTFKEFTRLIGDVLNVPVLFLKGLLVSGFDIAVSEFVVWHIPPVSWVGVALVPTLISLRLGKPYLAGVSLLSFFYVAFFGLWESTMLTVSSIVISVILGVVIGVLLGIGAHKWKGLSVVIMPALDFMQTMPVFAYLVPALVMFGYGPAPALIVTLIYAVPPMAHVTKLALARVPPEVLEFANMAGCSPSQTMWRVMIPSIRPRLMVGVNQVIMLSLNMVIIGSLIGAGGLGYDVWQSLKALRLGEGAEAGIAITLLAIVLDRISQEIAARRPIHHTGNGPFLQRNNLLIQIFAALSLTTVLGAYMPAFAQVPGDWILSTGRFWDNGIDWVNVTFFPYIDAVRGVMFTWFLKPSKALAMNTPWLGAVVALAILGYRAGGTKLAVLLAAEVFLIAAVGLWPQAMISIYLVSVSALIACVMGIPIGIACAWSDRFNAAVTVIIDTLQTLPTFVYLIPVIMLFGVGEFSAIVAVVLYSVVPAIRYTAHGIRMIRKDLIEAPVMMGCGPWQIISRVQIPLALPEILLGINQALMLALSMLVITALVGTRDLGQETLIALSKVDPGRGLVAGACVALIALIFSQLLNAWANQYKRSKGLE